MIGRPASESELDLGPPRSWSRAHRNLFVRSNQALFLVKKPPKPPQAPVSLISPCQEQGPNGKSHMSEFVIAVLWGLVNQDQA